jgi:CspA family cold shock protein
MPPEGVVRVWHREEGWGVVDSKNTPGGCWVHFSSVLVPGYRGLRAGQSVSFDYEPAVQDGHGFRATEVWPSGQVPYTAENKTSGETSAFRSTLTITFDDPAEPDLADPTL